MTALSIALAYPLPCRAGDAEDAVELLSYSLKCARKPVLRDPTYYDANFDDYPPQALRSPDEGGVPELVFVHVVERSLGNAREMIIEHEVTFENGAVLKWRDKANFADLDTSYIMNNPTMLHFRCSANHRDCVTVDATQGNGQTVQPQTNSGLTMLAIKAGWYTMFVYVNADDAVIELCDAVTTSRAKLAIDSLVALNKTNQLPPAAAPATTTANEDDLFLFNTRPAEQWK